MAATEILRLLLLELQILEVVVDPATVLLRPVPSLVVLV